MEAKLKALRVVDLRAILTKADQSAPAKSNKQDLISRIIASEQATAVYHAEHGAPDDLLAPPEDVDWTAEEAIAKSAVATSEVAVKPLSKAVDPPTAAAVPPSSVASSQLPEASAQVDPEEEKRRKRAERFGIPLVESKKARLAAQPPADSEALKARASRFGIKTDGTGKPLDTPQSGHKRDLSATEQIDPEELERRKKRAARFNVGAQAQGSVDPDEHNRREQRAARFGIKPTA
ncbi:hypothetical protein E1B28_009907 [Marasmius oreades]|uniref:THO1-MOS11 C-terminal domain-containing protein n=1 Tax=Marasmius oreades TaxID=181124 RepID=A0A9P7RW92_9AGAR|nr:uncharacterized protein E1B28_009907 [Marasmius oreades]KAG7090825.1 hypothetical protein E1B28_009907 [Marasmius oreades]